MSKLLLALGIALGAIVLPVPVAAQAPSPEPSAAPPSPQRLPAPRAACRHRPRRPRRPAQAPKLPPAGSPPLVRFIQITFPTQGDISVVEPRTYLYYIQTQVSRPSDGVWVPYDDKTEASLLEDFKRLWATNFLDDLSIEVLDAPYDNGVMGKRIIYKMEERQRVKIVDYTGSKKLDQTKIEEKLKEENILIRLDSFIDPGQIRKVESVVRSFMASKGYQYAEVTHELKPLPSGPKLVNLTFNVVEGPKVKIQKIEFEGNKAMSSGDLAGKMKHNKAAHWLSFITSRGVYQEAMFEEDADRIQAFYRDKGYISARVGSARDQDPAGREGRQDAQRRAEGARHRRRSLSHRQPRFRGQQGREDRGPAPAVQAEGRRLLQREADSEGHGGVARAVRHGRLLGVHGLSGPQAAQHPGPDKGERPGGG